MLTVGATVLERFASMEVADAKDRDTRFEILMRAELDRGVAEDFLVILDGMGSISIGLSLLRLLVETDTPRRVGLFGATPDIGRLIDAWERARLDELVESGRLKVVNDLPLEALRSEGLTWIATFDSHG